MAKGPKFAEFASQVASAINFDMHPFPVPWPHRYRAVELARGARIIVEESEDMTLTEVAPEEVTQRVVAWLRLQMNPDNFLTVSRAAEVVQVWLAITTPIAAEDIKAVRWKSEPGYTWRRLPWDAIEGDSPTWDKILGKMTNAAAFRQWLGSLLYDEAQQHQYVWVHGMGNDGKGCMNRFLARVFDRSYRSKQPPGMGDRFWAYGLIGARLVVFPDCNSQGFTTGGLFKSLSGGDPIDVEAKGRMSFTVRLNCKFLFFSNEKPNISCEKADMRRIIYCEFFKQSAAEDQDPLFEENLWAEGGSFLSRCAAEYIAACPRHQTITSVSDEIETWVSVHEEAFQHVYDQHFMVPVNELYRTSRGLAGLTLEQIDLVTVEPRHMLAVISDAFTDQKAAMRFRDWLYRKYSAQKVGIKRDGRTLYRYVGVQRLHTADAARKLGRKLEAIRSGVSTPSIVDVLST